MQPIYLYFAGQEEYDFSKEAALAQYHWETYGVGDLKLTLFSCKNGYAIGKHWMDVTVTMWKEDLKTGLLTRSELYREYPGWHWWLDKILK